MYYNQNHLTSTLARISCVPLMPYAHTLKAIYTCYKLLHLPMPNRDQIYQAINDGFITLTQRQSGKYVTLLHHDIDNRHILYANVNIYNTKKVILERD